MVVCLCMALFELQYDFVRVSFLAEISEFNISFYPICSNLKFGMLLIEYHPMSCGVIVKLEHQYLLMESERKNQFNYELLI